MNCRDIEPLLLTERDGTLTTDQRATLDRHVAACPACQQLRSRLAAALGSFRDDVAAVAVPDAAAEWETLRARLHGEPARQNRKRPLAPVLWFGSSLAAAAALALAYLGLHHTPADIAPAPPQISQANIAETGDANASTMAYVDKDSGWLVVWTTDVETKGKG